MNALVFVQYYEDIKLSLPDILYCFKKRLVYADVAWWSTSACIELPVT